MAVMTFVFCFSAFAKNYTTQGTYVWKQIDGLFYAYDAETGMLIRNAKVGKCFVDANGTRYLNCFVKGVYYNSNGYRRVKFKGGWIKTGGKYYFFKDQKRLTGYWKINGKRYYFESSGSMLYRWKRVDGEKYLFDYLDGHMHTGWTEENGKWYYLDPERGYLIKGWLYLDGVAYFLLDDYSMFKSGWQTIDGKDYYFDGYGRLQTGWLKIGTLTYYLGKDGARVTVVGRFRGRTRRRYT